MKLTLFIIWVALQPLTALLYAKAMNAKSMSDIKNYNKLGDILYHVVVSSMVICMGLALTLFCDMPHLHMQGVWDYIATTILIVFMIVMVALGFMCGVSFWFYTVGTKLIKNKLK